MDLTKILIEGETYWSPLCGECTVKISNNDIDYPIRVSIEGRYIIDLTDKGCFRKHNEGECLIFPSKENRDWSNYIKKGDLVLAWDYDSAVKRICFYRYKNNDRHAVSWNIDMSDAISFDNVELYNPSKHII